MPPSSPTAVLARVLAMVVAGFVAAAPAYALRIVNYNITNYPGNNSAVRDPHFRTILAPLDPDVVVLQEMQSQAGVDQFRNNVLNAIAPGEWASAPFINGNDTDNALHYKPAKVQLLGQWAWYPNPGNLLRLVVCYRLKPVGYTGAGAELRVYSQHLKASSGSANEAQRLAEAIGIRDSMNAMPPGTHAILMGDFNIYSGSESAFLKLKEVQADNDGRLYDPLNAPAGTWNSPALAAIHTQSPCNTCPAGSGFASGGLDDRFDMFLPTLPMGDGEGLDLLVSTYKPVGNDGRHYNLNITDAPIIPEGSAYATALWNSSDHLPIRVDLQLPARIAVEPTLDLGAVIVGGGTHLVVSNVAESPADELTHSMVAEPGFTAPAGTYYIEVGGLSKVHVVSAAPGPTGPRSGNLIINSDDPDRPSVTVGLEAVVFDHAVPSLDSLAIVTADTLDFGTQTPGGFGPRTARVHNVGYHPYQARIVIDGTSITGGSGRFSIAGSPAPGPIGEPGASYEIVFDDAGATQDSTYEAKLTITNADEPLPGWLAHPDLEVTLQARVTSGALASGRGPLPDRNRLHPPFPNPLERSSTVRFDLARATDARLEVFDLGGRRVDVLAQGWRGAGSHAIEWDGREAGGSGAGPGLYFIRLSGAGLETRTARLAVVR